MRIRSDQVPFDTTRPRRRVRRSLRQLFLVGAVTLSMGAAESASAESFASFSTSTVCTPSSGSGTVGLSAMSPDWATQQYGGINVYAMVFIRDVTNGTAGPWGRLANRRFDVGYNGNTYYNGVLLAGSATSNTSPELASVDFTAAPGHTYQVVTGFFWKAKGTANWTWAGWGYSTYQYTSTAPAGYQPSGWAGNYANGTLFHQTNACYT